MAFCVRIFFLQGKNVGTGYRDVCGRRRSSDGLGLSS